MKRPIFKGSAVAIITPFTATGIDFKKLRKIVDFHLQNKTDALVVCGSTGEASTMPDSEHLDTIACVIDQVGGQIPVIAGTGSNDTSHGVLLCKKAAELGADALLSVTPYYNKASEEGLYRHFKAMSDCTDLPIILYNVPSRTNMNIAPHVAKRLSTLKNIVAIKECNLLQVAKIAHLCGDDLAIYSGEDANVLPLMSLGGIGVISVIANIVPEKTRDMAHAFLDGDLITARKIQLDLLPLIDAIFSEVNPIPLKAAMNVLGWDIGQCRMPLCELSDEKHKALVNVMEQYDLKRYDDIFGS